MKLVKESKTPNGTDIVLENWEEYGYFLIGAYPIAKNTSKGRWVEAGKPFRLTIRTDNPDFDFSALERGEKTLQDMSAQYWNRKEDMFYMGMIDYYHGG